MFLRIFTSYDSPNIGVLILSFNERILLWVFYHLLLMGLSTRRVRYRFRLTFYLIVFRPPYFVSSFNGRRVTGLVPPCLETNSKIRGTNFDAGGVKPLPFSPHVPCLFPLLQDTSFAWKIYCTCLSYSGAELGVKVVILWVASPAW